MTPTQSSVQVLLDMRAGAHLETTRVQFSRARPAVPARVRQRGRISEIPELLLQFAALSSPLALPVAWAPSLAAPCAEEERAESWVNSGLATARAQRLALPRPCSEQQVGVAGSVDGGGGRGDGGAGGLGGGGVGGGGEGGARLHSAAPTSRPGPRALARELAGGLARQLGYSTCEAIRFLLLGALLVQYRGAAAAGRAAPQGSEEDGNDASTVLLERNTSAGIGAYAKGMMLRTNSMAPFFASVMLCAFLIHKVAVLISSLPLQRAPPLGRL
ncbi:unnamed protein product, partial [Prorocentrum cordatum]